MSKKIWQLWKAFAHFLGLVNTFLLLTLTYLLLIGPAGLILRFSGRDVLHKRDFQNNPRWVKKSSGPDSVEVYTHPF